MKFKFLICNIFFHLTFTLHANTGYEIMQKVHEQDKSLQTKIMKVSMQITDAKKRNRTRFFVYGNNTHLMKNKI